MTKIMPSMKLVKGVEYPYLYDIFNDNIYLNKDAKHKTYSSVRALCESTTHSDRLNNYSIHSLTAYNINHCVREIELNFSVFLLLFYMGGYGIRRLTLFPHIHEVIGSWVEHHKNISNGKAIQVNWAFILNTASYYVPAKDKDTFFKKIQSPRKLLAKRHLE